MVASKRNVILASVALVALAVVIALLQFDAVRIPAAETRHDAPTLESDAAIAPVESIADEARSSIADESERTAIEVAAPVDRLAAQRAATLSVRGLVVDEASAPVLYFGVRAVRVDRANGDVELRYESQEPGAPSDLGPSPETEREWPLQFHALGEFELDELPLGSWKIEPFAEGMSAAWSQTASESKTKRIVFVMNRQAFVRGVVLDSESRPVPDAEITVDGRVAPQRSAHDGGFQLAVDAGLRTLTARAAGFLPSAPLELPVRKRDDDPSVTFVLQRGASVRGVVLDAAGLPVFRCEIAPADDSAFGCTTDEHGRFELAGLPSGSIALSVTVHSSENALPETWIGCAQAETTTDAAGITIRLAFARTVRVFGRIERSDASGAPRVHVTGLARTYDLEAQRTGFRTIRRDGLWVAGTRVLPVDGRFMPLRSTEVFVDEAGRFTVDVPGRGSYRFERAEAFGRANVSTVVEVPDQATFEVNLKL